MNKSSLKETLSRTIHDVEDSISDVLYEKWHIRLHKKAKHHVHRLRKRPDHHKDIIAFGVAFTVTSVVFVGWYLFSFPRIIDSYKINKKENTALDISRNPFDGIKEKLQDTNIQTE